MEKLAGRPYDAADDLRCLVEAAIFERNPSDLFRRIEDAQDAIMDYIEDSFESASPAERAMEQAHVMEIRALPPRASPTALRNSAGRLSRPDSDTRPRAYFMA